MSRTDQLDYRIEEALRQIGNERLLSPTQRSRIRAAMIAAAQEQKRRRAQRSRGFGSLLWPRLLPVGLTLASVLLIAFAAYIFAGGERGRTIAQAKSNVSFTLLHKHTAPPGIVWYTAQVVQPDTPAVVAEGDILYASQVVTVTFSDQSIGVIHPDTEVAALVGERGLALRFGQINLTVQPGAQADAGPNAQSRFSIKTRRAHIAVRGTQFSVHSDDNGDTVVTTQGAVEATQITPTGATFSAQISAGEEVGLFDSATAPPVVQLHPPLAHAVEPDGRTIPDGAGTRQPEISFVGSAYPGGALTIDRPGLLLTTTVDSQGRFTVPVTLPALEGVYAFTLTIQAPDGRSRTSQLNVIVDRTAPAMVIDMPEISADGASVQIQGQTEPGATVTANGIDFFVDSDGRFASEVTMPIDRIIRIVARDFAGNESMLAQTVRPR
ncbi:MAG: FecR domain-containing protein [Candidatus Roseilinea sp.]|uniref:FecR domain-containing protein n=1 Tax=Candidatus Roseilinea sp. TaxID=2838777 RepID=UPI004049381B